MDRVENLAVGRQPIVLAPHFVVGPRGSTVSGRLLDRALASLKCLIADAVMLAQEPPELLGHRYAFLGRILLDRAMERLGEVQGETLYADWRLRRYTPYPSCLWVCPLPALCGCVGQFGSSPRRRVTSNFYVWNGARPRPHSPDA
jgi:hypothetical protein